MARPGSTGRSTGTTPDTDDGATRDRILAAAKDCFLQLGIAKSTMHDVARVAELSRGTVYRYFPDRRALIDATVSQLAQQHYDEAQRAMDPLPTLCDQVGAFGEVFAATFTRNRLAGTVSDDLQLFRIMASDIDGALRRMSAFLLPYVVDAKDRGELAPGVDEHEGSELLARAFMSLTVMPASIGFDIERPATVRRYLERYAVAGLAPRP
jgi:AcrR family transcriptional regulator